MGGDSYGRTAIPDYNPRFSAEASDLSPFHARRKLLSVLPYLTPTALGVYLSDMRT